jgi:CheY-like chemotaxis protein
MKRRVLLVDDNEELTFHLGRYLERRGCQVERVNEAPKALAVARTFQPDAIILDYFMPELNGADLAWQLEADEALRRVPVMICSGYAEKISPRELPPKAIPIRAKPFPPASILAWVQEIAGAPSG